MSPFTLCSLPELTTCHAVGVAEEAGQGGSAGDAGELADDGDGVVGCLQQSGYVFQAVAVDEVACGLAVRTVMDSLVDVLRIGAQHLCQNVAVQVLVGVGLLFGHQCAETAEELLFVGEDLVGLSL